MVVHIGFVFTGGECRSEREGISIRGSNAIHREARVIDGNQRSQVCNRGIKGILFPGRAIDGGSIRQVLLKSPDETRGSYCVSAIIIHAAIQHGGISLNVSGAIGADRRGGGQGGEAQGISIRRSNVVRSEYRVVVSGGVSQLRHRCIERAFCCTHRNRIPIAQVRLFAPNESSRRHRRSSIEINCTVQLSARIRNGRCSIRQHFRCRSRCEHQGVTICHAQHVRSICGKVHVRVYAEPGKYRAHGFTRRINRHLGPIAQIGLESPLET